MASARAAAQTATKTMAVLADRVRRPPRGVVVLLYHRVGDRSPSPVDLPASMFDEQMAFLAERGAMATLEDALPALDGAAPAGRDPVVVTFDDGTADLVEVVLPILERHRIPALVYVATEFVECSRSFPDAGVPLSWAAIRDALSTGLVTVGSHTHTHALLDRVDPAVAVAELDRSRALIEERTGVPALDFAYPKALAGSAEVDALVRARFRSAALGGCRPNPYGSTDPYRLSRSPIQRSDGMRFFAHKVDGGMALEDQLRRVVNRRRYANAVT